MNPEFGEGDAICDFMNPDRSCCYEDNHARVFLERSIQMACEKVIVRDGKMIKYANNIY